MSMSRWWYSLVVIMMATAGQAQESAPVTTEPGTSPEAAQAIAVVEPVAASNAVPAVVAEPAVTNAPAVEAHPVAPVVHPPAVTHPAPVVVHPATNVPAHTAPATGHVTNTMHHTAATNALLVPVHQPEPVVSEQDLEKELGAWRVGTRYTQYSLLDNKRGKPRDGSYFGTITEITEDQDNTPNKLYLQYCLFESPVWLGVSYDHVTAVTMDDSNGDDIPDRGGGDGYEEIKGYIVYLQAVWENETRMTPFVQAGMGFYKAEFVPNSWGDNGQRWVDAKSQVTGQELAGGLNVRIMGGLSADLFAKYMHVDDITGDWYYGGSNKQGGYRGGDFIMTMSYTAYGIGLNYRF